MARPKGNRYCLELDCYTIIIKYSNTTRCRVCAQKRDKLREQERRCVTNLSV